MKDHIVEEVRRIREQQAARFNFDPKAIMADARQRQDKSGHRVVSLSKPSKQAAA